MTHLSHPRPASRPASHRRRTAPPLVATLLGLTCLGAGVGAGAAPAVAAPVASTTRPYAVAPVGSATVSGGTARAGETARPAAADETPAPPVGWRPVAAADARATALAQGRRGGRPGTVGGLTMPTPAVTLPPALDRWADYTEQNSCDPTDKPGSVAYGELLLTIYPKTTYGISRSCTESGISEHKDGRAVDFMLNANDPTQKAVGDAITQWITADNGAIARRLGVMYLIWNKQIWGSWDVAGGWKPYTGSSPHTDHIHTSLTWDGAMKRTSWWTGVALTTWDEGPCRIYSGELAPIYTGRFIDDCPALLPPPKTTHADAVLGSRSADVTLAQQLLGSAVTGTFDRALWGVLRTWQAHKEIPVTGVLDQKTWSILDPSSVR